MDERFSKAHMIKQLPLWVRPFVDREVLDRYNF
jgi:hypothetical protein